MPVFERLCRHATRSPDKTALTVGLQSLNYGELLQRTLAARAFIQHESVDQHGRGFGVPAHARLTAICFANSVHFAEWFVAASAAPNVVAVLDPSLPETQLAGVLQRLMPDLLVLGNDQQPFLAHALRLGIRVCCLAAQQPEYTYQACLENPLTVPSLPLDQLQEPFLIGLTSGTTSLPKAFIRSRASWRYSLDASQRIFSLHDGMTTLAPGSLAQGIALYALMETLDAGAEFVTDAEFNVITLARRLTGGQIQRLVVVPTMLAALAVYGRDKQLQFASVRQLVSAGAKFDRQHWQICQALFPNAEVFEYYGASELSFITINPLSDGDIDTAISSVGYAFPGVDLTIRNPDGAILPDGEIGQVYLHSPLVCQGYLWRDDHSAFSQTELGATVGDLGFLQQRRLTIVGRAGGMIVSRGHNIYLSEVEQALKATGLISEAVALGLNDDYAGQRLVVVVEAAVGVTLNTHDLVTAMQAHIARQKMPQQFYQLRSWPLTAGGKIARRTLETWILDCDESLQRL